MTKDIAGMDDTGVQTSDEEHFLFQQFSLGIQIQRNQMFLCL